MCASRKTRRLGAEGVADIRDSRSGRCRINLGGGGGGGGGGGKKKKKKKKGELVPGGVDGDAAGGAAAHPHRTAGAQRELARDAGREPGAPVPEHVARRALCSRPLAGNPLALREIPALLSHDELGGGRAPKNDRAGARLPPGSTLERVLGALSLLEAAFGHATPAARCWRWPSAAKMPCARPSAISPASGRWRPRALDVGCARSRRRRPSGIVTLGGRAGEVTAFIPAKYPLLWRAETGNYQTGGSVMSSGGAAHRAGFF